MSNWSPFDIAAFVFLGFVLLCHLVVSAKDKKLLKALGALALGAGLVATWRYVGFWAVALAGFVFLDYRQSRESAEAREFRNEVRRRPHKIEKAHAPDALADVLLPAGWDDPEGEA